MANNRGGRPVVHSKKHIARLERERRQTRAVLISFIAILVISVGLLVYGYLDLNYFQLQKPVAKVGDVEITSKDFQTRVKVQRNSLMATYQQYQQFGQMLGMDVTSQLQQIESQLNDSQTLGQNVLDAMIDEELIRQESAKRGITVSEAELESAVRAAENYYPDGAPSPTATPTEIIQPTAPADVLNYVTATSEATTTPEATATPDVTATPAESLTPAVEVETTLTAELVPTATATLAPTATSTSTPTQVPTQTPSGTATPEPTSTPYTLESYQKNYADKIKAFSDFGLTEQQYRTFFETDLLREKLYAQVTADVPHTAEQLWARHILVTDEAIAQVVLKRIKDGEDFGKVAAEVSTDTGSAANGGDLGWFGKGTMVAPFEEAAYALKVGEISEPVQSEWGWHIIQVIARQERPLDASAYQNATDQAFQNFLDSLRDEYGVETFDLWMQVVPTVPSFESIATDAARSQQQ